MPGLGVIAQEVEAVFPELIEHTDAGYLRVEYDGLVPPLMLAVSELDARLRAIEHRKRGEGVGAEEQPGEDRPGRLKAATGGELRTDLDVDIVDRIFPELVITDENGERVVVYSGLVGVLIEAVKELDRRVSALEASSE